MLLMVGEEIISNATGDLVDLIIPALMERLGPFVAVFKVAGVVLLGYILYLFFRVFSIWRFRKRVKRIEIKVNSMDRKLDSVLKILEKGNKKEVLKGEFFKKGKKKKKKKKNS